MKHYKVELQVAPAGVPRQIEATVHALETEIESLFHNVKISEVSSQEGFNKCFKTPKMLVETKDFQDCVDLVQKVTDYYRDASIENYINEWPGDNTYVCQLQTDLLPADAHAKTFTQTIDGMWTTNVKNMPTGYFYESTRTNVGVCHPTTKKCHVGNNYQKECKTHEDCDGPMSPHQGFVYRAHIVNKACNHTQQPNACVQDGLHYTTGSKADPSILKAHEGSNLARNVYVTTDMMPKDTPILEFRNETTFNVYPHDGYIVLPERFFVKASGMNHAKMNCNANSTIYNSNGKPISGYADTLYTATLDTPDNVGVGVGVNKESGSSGSGSSGSQ